MTKQELIELGLNEEQIKEVFKLNGIMVNTGKQKLTILEEEKVALSAENEDLKGKLVNFDADLVDTLKSEKTVLEEQLAKIVEEKDGEITKITYDHLLQNHLKDAGARNIKAVRALLNEESLQVSEGKLVGIDEELVRLKSEDGYLFGEEKTNSPIHTAKTSGARPPESDPFTDAVSKIIGK